MLDLQHQYNNCTTIPHMKVGPTCWGPPSCEGLLCRCCIGVVKESNPIKESREMIKTLTLHNNDTTSRHNGVGPTHGSHSIVH
jgi:hypothetical protein